jgi:N-acetylglucosaminyldiphosphoundecaprenol N-acetyl-beta-D-mannosaminyltransferase
LSVVSTSGLRSRKVLGMRVDQVESEAAAKLIADWAAAAQVRSRTVCAANVHMTMEAHDDPAFRALVSESDLVLADGVPLVWALRALGLQQQRRVRVTPDLLPELFAACEARGIRLGLYGGTPQTLDVFTAFLADAAPCLEVAYAWSPPFRPLKPKEDAAVVEQITSAGVQLLLVGIGCPKQERWMDDHRDRLSCVMIGVGAAFDLFGGRTKEAPRWTRDIGLEWAYRLAQEPRRLWRRHAKHDPRFVALLAWQVVRRVAKRRSAHSC